MKKFITTTIFVFLTSTSLFAKTISSSQVEIQPSSVDQVIRLVDKKAADASHKKVSIIVKDRGLSTDVSPRFSIYFGYASLAEMGNIYADFILSENVHSFLSAKRISAGIYQVKFLQYNFELSPMGGLYEVTQTINAKKMFQDEQKQWQQCGGDFCDTTLKTVLDIKESVEKQ